jgi:hypothetical protein
MKQGATVIKAFKRKQPDFCYPAEVVWAAACAAYRINSGYLKYPDIQDGKILKPTNRDLVKLYLAIDNSEFITDRDRMQGTRCRQTLKNAVTMAALKGEMSEWNLLVAQMTALDRIETEYEVSVITALPKSYDQVVARENVDSRLAHCDTSMIGRLNERLTLAGEIVRCNYSAKYNTFYVTVITDANQQVFFAYRERLDPGRLIRFSGRVKRHADRATQLSRVKLIEQEAV